LVNPGVIGAAKMLKKSPPREGGPRNSVSGRTPRRNACARTLELEFAGIGVEMHTGSTRLCPAIFIKGYLQLVDPFRWLRKSAFQMHQALLRHYGVDDSTRIGYLDGLTALASGLNLAADSVRQKRTECTPLNSRS